ncbi:hypothetical protein ACFE04_019972 [Oxalis oulophora]
MDFKADVPSSQDSLSFSGLVCVHDHQSTTLVDNAPSKHIRVTSVEFEFSTTSPVNSKSNKISPRSRTNSTTQVLWQALQTEAKQSQVTNQLGRNHGLPPATPSLSKRSSDESKNNRISVSRRQDYELRSHSYRDHSTKSSSFFKSFVSTCKGCKVIEPTVKQPLPRKDVKLH